MSMESLEARLREIPFLDRLTMGQSMIGEMCSDGRPPRMTIPVQWNDEDMYISTTLKDAMSEIETLRKKVERYEEVLRSIARGESSKGGMMQDAIDVIKEQGE